MVDTLTPEQRSALMSRVRGKDTRPELLVRRTVYRMGYRYRLHQRSLPGAPDLVFSGLRKVIFVHGCFWHRHPGCPKATVPKTRTKYWRDKFNRNVERDVSANKRLEAEGWEVLIVWECETRKEDLAERLQVFLEE